MARRHDVLHAQAVHRWCPHARDRCCACKSAARKLRRSSASRAASRLVVLCGRRAAWSGSTTFGSARCRSLRELKRIVPWPLWLGRVRGHSGPSIACMRGRCIILMHYRKDVSHPGLDRTSPPQLPPLLGQVGDSFIPLDACMHGCIVRNRRIEERCPT